MDATKSGRSVVAVDPSGRPQAWITDVALAAIVLVVGTLPLLPGGPGPRPGGPGQPGMSPDVWGLLWRSLTLIVAAASMLLRRRFPFWVLGLTMACFVVSVLLGMPSFGTGAALTIATYAMAGRTDRKLAYAVGATISLVIVIMSFAEASWSSPEPWMFQTAAAVLIATALGDATRSRREYVVAMVERAERAEETRESEARRRVTEERLRIARDLHDTVGHQISVISLNAGVASATLRENPSKAEVALSTIRKASRGALAEIGDLLQFLRTEESTTLESIRPQPVLKDVPNLVEQMRSMGMYVNLKISDAASDTGGSIGTAAYRVIQEGLANAQKHGADQSALVEVVRRPKDEALAVLVANNVSAGDTLNADIDSGSDGEAPDTAAPGSGLGLLGLQERVTACGGDIQYGIRGDQFVIEAVFPMPQEDPA